MCFVGPCLHILCTLPAASFFVCTAHSFTKYTHTLTHTLAYTNNFFQTNTHSLDYPHTLSLLPPSVSPHAYALFIDFALRCAALHLLCSSLLSAQFFIYPMHTLSKSLCALQGHTRPNCERHRHPLVRHIGIETIRHGILHGPSTAADCLSVCGALWRICVDYHLLG